MKKVAKGFSTLAVAASFNLFAGASTAFADTFTTWTALKGAIWDDSLDGSVTGSFNISPDAVLEAAPGEYLYNGTFSGSLNGGVGDGLANINGLTRPLFNSLGAGASISGLAISAAPDNPDSDTGDPNIGVTGYGILADTASGATIENVRVGGELHADRNWMGVSNAGGLIGSALNTTIIRNSHFTGSVYATGNNVGGLVGYLESSSVLNSTSKSSDRITGINNVGGLVGQSYGSIIDSGMSVGLISADTAVGGIVGHATATDISNSLSKTLITASGDSVGGIAGVLANDRTTASELNNSIFKGAIVSNGDPGQVGGIVGLNYGIVENVLAIPMDAGITGDIRVGGLVGFNESAGIVRNSFFDGKVISGGSVGAIAGLNNGLIRNTAASGDIYSDENCAGDLAPGETPCSGLIVGIGNLDNIVHSVSLATIHGTHPVTNAADSYLPDTFPQHFLNYLNAAVIPDLWEVDPCFNSNRPFKSSIKSYVSSDCERSPESRPIFDYGFIRTLATERAIEIKQSLGFELTDLLTSNIPLKIITKLSEADLSQVITSSFDLNTTREITLQKQTPLQLSLSGQSRSMAQVWLQTPTGEWIKLGQIEFDEEGKAVLPALLFEDLGDYKLSFFSAPEWEFIEIDPIKSPIIGSINLAIR